MNVSIWANHGSNIFGVSDNLHFTEFFAILQDPCPQRITFFGAIMNPATFAVIQIEASNAIHGTKRQCQRSHKAPKRRGSHSKVVSVSTLGRLQEAQVVRVPWDDYLLEPFEDRFEGHCKKKTARWTALSYTLAIRNCPWVVPANSTCVVLSL